MKLKLYHLIEHDSYPYKSFITADPNEIRERLQKKMEEGTEEDWYIREAKEAIDAIDHDRTYTDNDHFSITYHLIEIPDKESSPPLVVLSRVSDPPEDDVYIVVYDSEGDWREVNRIQCKNLVEAERYLELIHSLDQTIRPGRTLHIEQKGSFPPNIEFRPRTTANSFGYRIKMYNGSLDVLLNLEKEVLCIGTNTTNLAKSTSLYTEMSSFGVLAFLEHLIGQIRNQRNLGPSLKKVLGIINEYQAARNTVEALINFRKAEAESAEDLGLGENLEGHLSPLEEAHKDFTKALHAYKEMTGRIDCDE